MLIEGEKYACDACVRGHRVSNCQHADRPLTHINKKGRPVSQCPHCRGLRKARASHVKCDCGEKPHTKEDCVHAEGGDSKLDTHICCCTHGARCPCALKKEHLDPVPELDAAEASVTLPVAEVRKPRLATAQSESSLMVFANGHHKPAHKHNDAAHKCGLPYKIPRPHSIHGPSEVSAQRSADSLPLMHTTSEFSPPSQDSVSSAPQDVRQVRSAHGSPKTSEPTTNLPSRRLTPLDLSFSTFETATPSPLRDDFISQAPMGFESYYPTPEEQAISSASYNVDWSAFDLPLDNGAYSTTYSQPQSYTSFDYSNVGQPGLTTSSSGEVSEAGDYIPHGLPSPPIMNQNHYVSGPADAATSNTYRLSSASSYMGIPQASVLANSNADGLDLDPFFQGSTASPADFEEQNAKVHIDPEAYVRHGITVQDAQKLAHSGVPVEAMNDLSIPATTVNADPLWAPSYPADDMPYAGDSELSENGWLSS
ncbi:Copper fist DNA-binding [Lasallia pustulata]|uniref:Copper fist DNA-binding n=1 Tax=Lasallia pustulata TaxID=136370 RepID=A0A1W5CUJ0_9LECA|nr:Copper fist DNA-binding [Lasallia pustulata]